MYAYTLDQQQQATALWTRIARRCGTDIPSHTGDATQGGIPTPETVLTETLTDGAVHEADITLAEYGEHTARGGAVDRHVVEWMASEYAPYVREQSGCHPGCSQRAVLRLGELPTDGDVDGGIGTLRAIAESLEALDEYPVLDESHLGEVERLIVSESWEDYLHADVSDEAYRILSERGATVPSGLTLHGQSVDDVEDYADYLVEHSHTLREIVLREVYDQGDVWCEGVDVSAETLRAIVTSALHEIGAA